MANELEKSDFKIHSNIEKKITDFLREQLNDNSQEITFKMGFWNYKDDTEGRYIDAGDPDSPKETNSKEKYIPTVIDVFDGDILGIEGIFNTEYTAPMQFMLTADNDKMMMDAISAIEETKHRLRGNYFRWKINYEDEDGNEQHEYFNVVTDTDNLTPIGDTDEQMGERYVFAQLNINFGISHGILYGNHTAMYIRLHEENASDSDYKRLYPIEPSFSRENKPKSFESFGDKNQIEHVIQDSHYTLSFGLYNEDLDIHSELKKDIFLKERLNRPFDIKIEFYRYFGGEDLELDFTFEDTVILLESEGSFAIGEEQFLTLSFGRYLEKGRS